MNALVVYDSQYGNTERIALAITEALRPLGQARLACAGDGANAELRDADILILGCPTQGWRPTVKTLAFLDGIPLERLRDLSIACFDTRFHKARWLTGSAARVLAQRIERLGGAMIVPPESFFVLGTEGPLERGEPYRAAAWARSIAGKLPALHLVTH